MSVFLCMLYVCVRVGVVCWLVCGVADFGGFSPGIVLEGVCWWCVIAEVGGSGERGRRLVLCVV